MTLQIPIRSTQQTTSAYAKLGLKDLPFPFTPVADPYNTDPRRNGAIYADKPIRPSIDKFEQLLIRPNDFANRVRLAYLWSRGDQETGRGMGKTALLRYFRQRINQDWGRTEFSGQFSALVIYVSFPYQVDRRYMEQLALSALVDICKSRVLEASRASQRLEQTDEATVYQVRARHRNEEVREVVPSDYGGVMVTDRGRSYDAQALSGVKQQKCLAHVLRSISEVVQTKRGRGRSFGNRLSRLLREAMELRQAYHRGEAADFAAEAERLRREATYHLRDRPMPDADNWRLQNELGWHDDRGNLLRFLDDPSIEPTNNRAERALRPAVIARKVSHCSKNVGGADAFSAFTSVIRTLARNGGDHSLVNGLCGVFSGAPVPTPSF